MPNTTLSKKSAWPWLILTVLIIAFDQYSKYLILESFHLNQIKVLTPFLNLMLTFNSGSAFGFLSMAGGWQVLFLIVFVSVVVIILFVWLLRLRRNEYLLAIALSLILGGAMGNLSDRVRWGYVVDFVDFHIGAWHFATFNVGDSAVCVGAFLLIVKFLFFSKK